MTIVLVDPRRPSLVPMAAIELLCRDVQYTEELPVMVAWLPPWAQPIDSGQKASVLLSSDASHPVVISRIAAGEQLVSGPSPQCGERLIDAVALIDKLRVEGSWEANQTHESFRLYLLEEVYELLDAVRTGDSDQLREELGDLLLQVIFHARIAADAPINGFTIDDVAEALVQKLEARRLGVLAGESPTLDQQLAQWEGHKAAQKARTSAIDDVLHGQPALVLAQKVIQRVVRAGLPVDLIPRKVTSVAISADTDAENNLRTDVVAFMDTVRAAELAIAASRRNADVTTQVDAAPVGLINDISEEEWRAYWPSDTTTSDAGTEQCRE
ncbi:nucleoside triphosphate pyrophosphohydrolase [Mycobacterium vicinigordonae]|uniref:Nucleoside triphosphate pyrophosphohydrolase n=1 Tax=Mycobacterium vicinigordonae TaxID=1719132 RepID=A0A7D6ISN0_9MYCO|nr:nucleoside triphosphate pyrophosphohydrolase [Mycobacterium vicinigordonae]QLL07859.1 nucleoside triphosphate pyrophosphohydrolase [Mycobacterium vicinigordonae]